MYTNLTTNHWIELTKCLRHKPPGDRIRIGNNIKRKLFGIKYNPVQICYSIKNFELCEIRVNDQPFMYEI